MLSLLKKVLDPAASEPPGPGREREEAAVSLGVLLLEAAHADGECSREEMEHVITTLVDQGGVERKDIDHLLDRAYQRRQDAVDLFSFTRYLNQHYSKEQKLDVLESVWRVIHTDGRLEAHEDQFAHKLANLLRLTHRELIDAKIKARRNRQPDVDA